MCHYQCKYNKTILIVEFELHKYFTYVYFIIQTISLVTHYLNPQYKNDIKAHGH